MDKINIVSSQAVLELSSFSTDTRSMSSSPLVNSLVKNRLFKTASGINEPPFQFINTTLRICLWHRHDAAWQPLSRNPQDWDLSCLEATGWAQNRAVKSGVFWRSSSTVRRPRCAGALSCYNKSLPADFTLHSTSFTVPLIYSVDNSVHISFNRFQETLSLVHFWIRQVILSQSYLRR